LISLIIKTRDTDRRDTLPDEVKSRIKAIKGNFVGEQMPATRRFGNAKIQDVTVDTFDFSNFGILNAKLNLGWKILWAGELLSWNTRTDENGDPLPNWRVLVPVDPELINHLPDEVTYNSDGNEISRKRPAQVYETHRIMGMPARPLSVSATYYLSDTFTDPDGTLIADHSPETGSGYTLVSGAAQITENKLVATSAKTVFTFDEGQENGVIRASFTPDSVDSANGIWVFFQGTTKCFKCEFQGGDLRIWECDFLCLIRTQKAVTGHTPGSPFTLKVTLSGRNITLEYVATGESISYGTIFPLTITTHGVSLSHLNDSLDDLTFVP